MRLKKVYRILITLIFVFLITFIAVFFYNEFTSYTRLYKEEEIIENDNPVFLDHMNEFDIKESNYIENNYERYLAYKKKHSDYSDDLIVTYVNIGLDYDFYTNMTDTDMSDGYLIICNKYHKLKSDYVPNLVSLDGYGGGQMEKVAAEHFKEMVNAAKKDGMKIYNVSGYRSYNTQKNLYNGYVSRNGQAKADTFSARAGTSEHQTGLATDVNYVSDSFANTKEYQWLIKNSYKYGFILRYPKGKEFITGYKYEPWHYRYVGKDVAKVVYEKNITYEEYYATYILKG
jgi:D-alanyl-D-alanine carboxypeptidase